jgi:hypothetical protein
MFLLPGKCFIVFGIDVEECLPDVEKLIYQGTSRT